VSGVSRLQAGVLNMARLLIIRKKVEGLKLCDYSILSNESEIRDLIWNNHSLFSS